MKQKDYDKIILFGPSNVKLELFDTLNEDECFLETKIEIKNTTNMTTPSQKEFTHKHFSNK
jgi:hypothetical protein